MDLMAEFMTTHFWVAVGQIIMIDILLGGDNAVVIALACRRLPPAQRRRGIILGTTAAVGLRFVLIIFAMNLLRMQWVKLAGAVLLIWIGVKLVVPDPHEQEPEIAASSQLWIAVKTIVVADLVMSLDNVLGIAAAAQNAGEQHEMLLVIVGLLISVPIIVGGSAIVLKLMERVPAIVTAGGMLLGWIAGSMAYSDPAIAHFFADTPGWHYVFAAGGALLVLALAFLWRFTRPAAT